MGSLLLYAPGRDKAIVGAPRRVTFVAAGVGQAGGLVAGPITAPIIEPAVSHRDLAGNWVQIPRPGRKPLLRWQGPKLHTYVLTIWVDDDYSPAGDSEVDLHIFNNSFGGGAGAPSALAMGYSGFEGFAGGPFWSITDMQVDTILRREGDNKITRAKVTMTLTEQPEGRYLPQVSPRPAPPAAPPAAAVPSAPGQPTALPPAKGPAPAGRTYTVRAGDTLWSIAVHYYGDGTRWPSIADANGISDPRRLKVGAVLRIP